MYFQPNTLEEDSQKIDIVQKYVPALQMGDILSITVSSLSPEASAMFNPYVVALGSSTAQSSQTNNLAPVTGYLVDEDGYITLPLLGKFKVSGLTSKQVTQAITNQLEKYLQQPTVNLRILNFRVSILGEVAKPSVYMIPNEKITLPEALGLAGDLTIYGQRNNVMIVRETDGKREFARVDLTKRDLFDSPYYYLHANDVIYVEATKGKVTSTDRTVQLAPIILS
ncbi:MAG: periplasmic protein involved in polysaccharide export, partial [Daejeonella sp.]|nr:periplasmic protein involved in polysaccharide export [Daejeonella sp.]